MPKTFVRDGDDIRHLRKIFVRDGNDVRQLTKLFTREGNAVRLIYNRIKDYLLSGTAITTQSAVVDIQTLTAVGRSNVFIAPVNQEIEVRVSSDFDSGGFTGSINSSSSSASDSSDLGNGVFLEVNDDNTSTSREEVILAPASNGGSISNPGTATFNIRDGVSRVNWDGGTSSTEVAPYRARTSTGGAAGTRVTGGSSTRFPSGYAGFDEGAYTGGVQFTATNIPNPTALPAGSVVGGVTTVSGASPVLSSYIGGTQQSTNTAIRMAVVHGRGRNFAYQGEGASSFSQRLYFLNSGATGIRASLFGPTVTYNNRQGRIFNNSRHTIRLNGTIGGRTFTNFDLATGQRTEYGTVNGDTLSYNISYTNVVSSWSGQANGVAITSRNFGNNINADTAIGEILAAVQVAVPAATGGAISTSGSNRIQVINLGPVAGATDFTLTPNGGLGSFTFASINSGTAEFGMESTYRVFAPNNTQIGSFSSFVTDAGASDATFVASEIARIITSMTEMPINYNATSNTNVATATAVSAGARAGIWRVVHDDNGQTNNAGTMIVTAGSTRIGLDEVLPTQFGFGRVNPDGSATTLISPTLNSGETTDEIGARLGALDGFVYDSNTNILTVTSDRDDITAFLIIVRNGNGITLTEV